MYRLLILLLIILSCSCYRRDCSFIAQNTKTIYNIHLDSTIHPDDVIQIGLAFNFWKEVSGGTIDYQILYGKTYALSKYNDIFFTKEVSSNKELLALFIINKQLIKIMTNNIDDDQLFKNTIIHELGHFFGLNHSSNPNSYMFYAIGNKTSSLTKEDKEEFCQKVCCR